MPARVLYVEDEAVVSALIKEALAAQGHEPIHAQTCAEGWRCAKSVKPDLVILDINLPDGTGLDLCRRIRADQQLSRTPVIMLTALGGMESKAEGFESGADQYLVKPLEARELQLWVSALLRRVEFVEQDQGVLRGRNIVLDPQLHTVTVDGDTVSDLTRKEFDLLYELVRRRPKVLSKQYILSNLWHSVLRDNVVEVHICSIRRKLKGSGHRIVTVPGVGYRFD